MGFEKNLCKGRIRVRKTQLHDLTYTYSFRINGVSGED